MARLWGWPLENTWQHLLLEIRVWFFGLQMSFSYPQKVKRHDPTSRVTVNRRFLVTILICVGKPLGWFHPLRKEYMVCRRRRRRRRQCGHAAGHLYACSFGLSYSLLGELGLEACLSPLVHLAQSLGNICSSEDGIL